MACTLDEASRSVAGSWPPTSNRRTPASPGTVPAPSIHATTVILPMFHEMTIGDVDRVVDARSGRPDQTASVIVVVGSRRIRSGDRRGRRACNDVEPTVRLLGFVDDDPSLQGSRADGVRFSDPPSGSSTVPTSAPSS